VSDAGAPGRWTLRRGCTVLALALAAAAVSDGLAARQNAAWLRLIWVKGQYEARPLVEKWNSFLCICVIGNPERVVKLLGWGLSTALLADRMAYELHFDIDSYAGTELTAFHGDLEEVAHLKYDVINIAHYLRPDSWVIVVGIGGG